MFAKFQSTLHKYITFVITILSHGCFHSQFFYPFDLGPFFWMVCFM